MNFSDFAIRREIIQALTDIGYHTPTEVQSQVITPALSGKNMIVQSQTGSGKTAAFVIPALNLIETRTRAPQVLILEPTRELAVQTRDEVYQLSRHMRMGSVTLFGGSPIFRQKESMKTGPQVIVATPGRLADMLDRGWVDLSQVSMLILDEVDQMMDMGFAPIVTALWDGLPALKQVMSFSATYTRQITEMIESRLQGETERLMLSSTPTVDTIDHAFMRVGMRDKYPVLKQILDRFPEAKVMIFTSRKHETEEIERYLYRDGVEAAFIHGDMHQRDRMRALKNFKEGQTRIFIGTDVASRGLNMNNIDLVINYHVPQDPESYIHRIGRTGRAGAEGKAIMFVSTEESRTFARIEKMHKIEITEIDAEGTVIPRVREPRREGGRSGGGRRGGRGYRGGRSGGYRGGNSGNGGGYRGGNSGSSEGRNESRGGYHESRNESRGENSGGGYRGGNGGKSHGGSEGRRNSGAYRDGSSHRVSRDENQGGYREHRSGAPRGR